VLNSLPFSGIALRMEYLVGEMERGVEELVLFPQYFAFSWKGRIMPRQSTYAFEAKRCAHLSAKNVDV